MFITSAPRRNSLRVPHKQENKLQSSSTLHRRINGLYGCANGLIVFSLLTWSVSPLAFRVALCGWQDLPHNRLNQKRNSLHITSFSSFLSPSHLSIIRPNNMLICFYPAVFLAAFFASLSALTLAAFSSSSFSFAL